MIFLAMQSNFAFLFSASVHWDQCFSIEAPSFSNLGIKGPFSIASQIPLSRDYVEDESFDVSNPHGA